MQYIYILVIFNQATCEMMVILVLQYFRQNVITRLNYMATNSNEFYVLANAKQLHTSLGPAPPYSPLLLKSFHFILQVVEKITKWGLFNDHDGVMYM